MQRITVLLIAFQLLLTLAVHGQERSLLSDTLLDKIHDSSRAYHALIRNYDCHYTELRRTNDEDPQQKSTKRVVEDQLGQMRMESDIRRYDAAGKIMAGAKVLHVYDLRKEIRCYFPKPGDEKTPRSVVIAPDNSIEKMTRPRNFFTAEGRPFHELIDELKARGIPIYGGEAAVSDYPGSLVEFNYDEVLQSGDILRHEILLNMGDHFFPMRQVTFFNQKRFRVLQPSPQLVDPGVLFPIEGTKISYNIRSERNELVSITNYSVDRLELNSDIANDTFTFELLPDDDIEDLRPTEPKPTESDPIRNDVPVG